MLRAAELEIAILFEYDWLNPSDFDRFYEGIELHDLMDDPMYLALPRDHALHAGAVRLDDSLTRPGFRRPARTAGAAASTRRSAPSRASPRGWASGRTTTTSCRA